MAKQKQEKKIQDYNLLYDKLRYYVDLALKLSYRRIQYVGKEFIPKDGAVIFAPNHTNALMDALVILALDHSPKVFVARADIFRNPKVAKILKFLRILPIMRMRDGLDEVKKNNETIERAVDVLRDRIPFCIFPEGTHLAKYSSLPLAKGIFRIALSAQELMPDMPLYIVPVGIRYGNFFRFRSTVRVQIGEAINVGKFVAENSELTVAEQMTSMRAMLTEHLHRSIFYIPNDEDYDAMYEMCATVVKDQIRNNKFVVEGKRLRGMDAYFEANNRTIREIQKLKEQHPEEAARLMELGHEASKLRKSQKISIRSVAVRFSLLSFVLKSLIFVLTLPYTLPTSLLTLPLYGVSVKLFKLLKDYAFRNSARFLVNLIGWPLLMIIYSVIAYICLPWQWALPLTLILLPGPIIAHETWRLLRLLASDVKLLKDKTLRGKYSEMKRIFYSVRK